MNVREAYEAEMVKTLHKMHPDIDIERIRAITHRATKSRMLDPSIHMENNITGNTADISLSKLCGWIENANPVISGNATFYCQPEDLQSPTSNMLKSLKVERKSIKKEMFKCKPGSDEYQQKDLSQGNKKVIMNSDYGGSGNKNAAFYNEFSPAATTLMAQSIITTMAAFFEGYIGDNHKFFHISECMDWMNTVIKKDQSIPNWMYIPGSIETARQVAKHFIRVSPNDLKVVYRYIDNCNSKERCYLYYANNFKELIRHHKNLQDPLKEVLVRLPDYEAAEKEIPDRFKDKFNNPDEDNLANYNKWVSREMFLDPYNMPECIKEPMEEFISYMHQFVYVEYITPDSIMKLNNHKRNTVLLVDTDSNMLNADLFVQFILNEIFPDESFGRKRMYNEMILVNVLASTIDKGVASMLDYYGRCHHMNEDARKELTMKNEFLFRMFFLMDKKKRYAASIVLREGNIIIPFKPEIKGMDFIKAGVTLEVSKRFEKILCDNILFADKIDLHAMMRELKKFEQDIFSDLTCGGLTYLKQQQFKDENGYKNIQKAWSLPVFRGVVAWNELSEDHKIYPLDRVHILKLAVDGPSDLECIKDKYPEEYEMAMKKIFLSDRPEIVKCGMKYLCIPSSVKKIQDWIIPLVNRELIVSDTIAVFRSILEALNIEEMQFKTPTGNASITSCLISI